MNQMGVFKSLRVQALPQVDQLAFCMGVENTLAEALSRKHEGSAGVLIGLFLRLHVNTPLHSRLLFTKHFVFKISCT